MDVDSTVLTDGVTAVTLLGIVLASIKIALGQADKRASVAEVRESVCTSALAAAVVANEALTEEVRDNNREGAKRMENLERELNDIKRVLTERR